MIACFHRALAPALFTASVLVTAPAWAGDPPADPPAAPVAAEGAPALQQMPYRTPLTAPPTVRKVDASEPRKITGMVLTAIGIYHGFAGTVVLSTFAGIVGGTGGFGLAYGLVFGGPLIGEGLVLSCIGIPLWVSGAKTVVKTDDAEQSRWVPSLDVNAGRASATWHF